METFEELIFHEFSKYGYKEILSVGEMKLFGLHEAIDYWLVSPILIPLTKQKEIFDLINGSDLGAEFMEKNISLLFLVNEDIYTSCDRILIENNKAYFKKYVLSYTSETASQLKELLQQRRKESIAELILDEELFEALKDSSSHSITLSSLLYSIAHKLPFIPILRDSKTHISHEYFFTDPNLFKVLDWVNSSPENDIDLDKYVETLLTENNQ